MTDDLGQFLQHAVLEGHGALGPDRQAWLERLRPSLAGLRNDYAKGRSPDFSKADTRAAYCLAYLPHHAVLAAAAFGAAGARQLGLVPDAQIVVLGAGPGPEVIGLAHALSATESDGPVTVHLVDREQGWAKARRTTIESTVPDLWGGRMQICEHLANLATSAGLDRTEALISEANLVIAEALLTELPDPSGDGALVDRLIRCLPAAARLLVIDLKHVPRYQNSRNRLDSTDQLITVLRSPHDFPAARAIPELRDHLFSDRDMLRARSGVRCDVRLYARPGGMLPPLTDQSFQPTEGQREALRRFDEFLAGPDRIFVLSGAAGTGKTALFPEILRRSETAGLPVRLLAPTGQAARRLAKITGRGGATVHSEVYRFERTEYGDEDTPPVSVFGPRAHPAEPALYLIDESSLIGDRSPDGEKPEVVFGQGHLLSDLLSHALAHPASKVTFVGDPHQLPPVGEDEPPALTHHRLLDLVGSEPATAELTEIVRQSNTSLISFAHGARTATRHTGLAVGEGDPEAGINLLRSPALHPWLRQECLSGDAVVVTPRNADARDWNRRIRREAGRPASEPVPGDLVHVLHRHAATGLLNGDELVMADAGDEPRVIALRSDQITVRPVVLRSDVNGVGRVLFDALIVEDLLAGATTDDHRRVSQILLVDFARRHPDLKQGTPAFAEVYAADPTANALRIGYSYARTGHRAQGGEWDNVIVDFTGARSMSDFGRWAYTALTRTRQALWLRNVPRSSGPMGADALAAGATEVIEGLDLDVVNWRPIQSGVQMTVSYQSEAAAINIYEKKGLPSSAHRTGAARPAFTEALVAALDEWATRERLDAAMPVPETLIDLSRPWRDRAQAGGYDLSVERYADYQVAIVLAAGPRRATVRYSHRADGTLTSEQAADGPLDLLQRLKQIIRQDGPL